ncbi:MAG TPA: translocation/assembly module TamB domain-containing protein [bacterium]|nr:translocation/assembly module TamB domain-containing protein [bacterium]
MKFLRILGKTLRILLVTAGILILLVAGGIFAVLKKPELVFNPKGFRIAAAIAGRFGVIVAWDQARIHVQSKRLLHKRFDFGFDNFCFNLSANHYQGCMGELRLVAEVAWLGGGIKVLEVGPLTMSQADLSLYLVRKPEEKTPPEAKPFNLNVPDLVLPESLKGTYFHPISLQWKRLTLWQEEKMLFTGPLSLEMQPDPQGRPETLSLTLELEEGTDLPAGRLSATLKSPSNFWLNDWTLQGSADAALKGKGSGKADISLAPIQPKVYAVGVKADGVVGSTKANLDLNARLSEGNIQGRVSAEARGFSKQIHGVLAQACGFHVQQLARRDRMRLSMNCPLRVDVTPVRLPSPAYTKLVTIPQNLDFILKTELETHFLPSLESPVAGTLDLEMIPISQQLLTFKGDTKTKFSGVPGLFPKGWTALTDLDFFATVPRFQKVVEVLDKTAFAIFAPLNVLDGEIEFGLSGQTDLIRSKGKLPVVFKTRLNSQTQAFNSDGKGEIEFEVVKKETKAQLLLEIILDEAKLVLPHLGMQALPQILPDNRLIDPKKVVKAARADLKYQVKVKTAPDKPARLFSNLSKDSVPLYLDLTADNLKLDGTVKIGKTPLSILRRNVSIQEFTITLAEPTDFSQINGTIRVDYSNYDIDLLILGTMKRPRVVFQSNPPLSQEEIISVLIYGEPYDALDTSQSNSVGNVASAVADRALRLSSLFLLASTPVESVGYDPASGYVSARFRLGGDTSLEVGTQEGHTQKVGLRKNIGGNWIMNTYIENDSDEGSQRGGAFLDWYKRY